MEAERTMEDLLRLAVEIAPRYSTAKEVFQAVNEQEGIDKPWNSWRGLVNRFPERRGEINSRLKRREQPTVTTVTGVTAGEWPNEDDIWNYLVKQWEKRDGLETRRKAQQVIISDGPFCLVHLRPCHC